MKILFVNFTKFWGGGEQWTYLVMEELRKRGHNICLLSNSGSELNEKSGQNGFENHDFSVNKFSVFNPYLKSKIKQRLVEIKPDAIILNSTFELKVIGLLIKASGCPKVIYTRGIPAPMKMRSSKSHLFSHVVTNVIVNSEVVKNSISNITRFLKTKPDVVYHGIVPDSEVFSAVNNKNIVIVGRLSHEKGIDNAILVMQKVVEVHPDAKLWIIGTGKEESNLKKLTVDLGLQNSIEFFGFKSGVEEHMLECSTLIMTSRWEGFGLVLLEAMKLKMPCVAFDHLAANEIIVNNETGFLIPDKSIDIMAEKVSYLLSNPHIAKQMGEKGNDLLKAKFSIDKCIDKYEEVLVRK
jgi:Glycosyltransferase